jgi:hypothetical protein
MIASSASWVFFHIHGLGGGVRFCAVRADLLPSAGHRLRLESRELADEDFDPLLQGLDFLTVFTPIAFEAVDQPLCSAKIAFRIAR